MKRRMGASALALVFAAPLSAETDRVSWIQNDLKKASGDGLTESEAIALIDRSLTLAEESPGEEFACLSVIVDICLASTDESVHSHLGDVMDAIVDRHLTSPELSSLPRKFLGQTGALAETAADFEQLVLDELEEGALRLQFLSAAANRELFIEKWRGGLTEERRTALADTYRTLAADEALSDSDRASAEAAVFELERLHVGAIAPDIVGKDLDGVEFRLSDYRGKVVMLDFWGDW